MNEFRAENRWVWIIPAPRVMVVNVANTTLMVTYELCINPGKTRRIISTRDVKRTGSSIVVGRPLMFSRAEDGNKSWGAVETDCRALFGWYIFGLNKTVYIAGELSSGIALYNFICDEVAAAYFGGLAARKRLVEV